MESSASAIKQSSGATVCGGASVRPQRSCSTEKTTSGISTELHKRSKDHDKEKKIMWLDAAESVSTLDLNL